MHRYNFAQKRGIISIDKLYAEFTINLTYCDFAGFECTVCGSQHQRLSELMLHQSDAHGMTSTKNRSLITHMRNKKKMESMSGDSSSTITGAEVGSNVTGT